LTERPGGAAPQAAATPEPVRKKRKPRGRFECELGILLGAGGLIGSRLGQLWIAFDVFAQFTLQFALITLAFVIGFFMPRARLLAAFLVIIVGLVAIGVWPHLMTSRAGPAASAKAGETELRAATFNTWYSNRNAAAVRAEIERLDAGVIALMEVSGGMKQDLQALKSRYPYQADCFAIDFCNLAILSKYPFVETEGRAGWEGPAYLRAKLGPELGGLTVLAVHTIRFPHSRAQLRQAIALSSLIEALPGEKLLMGDFNATPFSRIVATITERTGLKRLSSLPTWPSNLGLPQVAIDHLFVSRGIRMTGGPQLGAAAGSDHYPVVVTLAVPQSP